MKFARPEYWSEQPFPPPGHLPNPGIEPRSPALQVDSLPAEPQGKPMGVIGRLLFCLPQVTALEKTDLSLTLDLGPLLNLSEHLLFVCKLDGDIRFAEAL